jgi:hypothetical protein
VPIGADRRAHYHPASPVPPMSTPVRILQVGLGPIGLEMARRAARRPDHCVVGGCDVDPALRGRSLAELVPEGRCQGSVAADIEEAVRASRPDVALVTTVSDLARAAPTCEALLRLGVAVVSTCEEMAYPFLSQPALARSLDEAGRAGGAACVGTGVNPGFVLDFLPVILSAPCDQLRLLRAERVVDAARRRGPLQEKVGAGLWPEEFARRVAGGGFGHRGFLESLHLVCTAFGVDPVGGPTFIRPVIAEREVRTEFVHVRPGQVAGIHQGAQDAAGRIVLDLKMYVGAEHPHDRVELTGEPSVLVQVPGGYHGDVATCAIALNAIASVRKAAPGLRSMLDLPPVHARFRS